MIPWAIPRSQSKWHDDQFSHFHTGDCSVSLSFTMGTPFTPNCPFPRGIWTSSNTIPWANSSPQPKRHFDWFRRFSTGGSSECPYTLLWVPLPPPQIASSHRQSETPSNKWFPGLTRVPNQNCISVILAIFAWLTSKVRTDSSAEFGSNPIFIDQIRIESVAGSNPILIVQIRTALDRAVDSDKRVTAFTTGRACMPSSNIKGGYH